MKIPATLVVGTAMLLILAGPAGAQEEAAVEAPLPDQLAQLNQTMQKIVTLLERQVEGQETSLMIKRIELSGRTLIAKKDRLRKMKSEASNLEDEQASLAPMVEAMEQELTRDNDSEGAIEMQITRFQQRLKTIKRRRQDLANEQAIVENEVRSEEEDMAVIEAVLDERLGLR